MANNTQKNSLALSFIGWIVLFTKDCVYLGSQFYNFMLKYAFDYPLVGGRPVQLYDRYVIVISTTVGRPLLLVPLCESLNIVSAASNKVVIIFSYWWKTGK